MIDVRRLRTDLERTIAALARKRVPEDEVRRAAALDSENRQLAARSEELRSRAVSYTHLAVTSATDATGRSAERGLPAPFTWQGLLTI